MVFNKEITVYENEEEFASYLNRKQVERVYPNFLELLYKLQGYLDYKDYIECWVIKSKRKADIYIKIGFFLEKLIFEYSKEFIRKIVGIC